MRKPRRRPSRAPAGDRIVQIIQPHDDLDNALLVLTAQGRLYTLHTDSVGPGQSDEDVTEYTKHAYLRPLTLHWSAEGWSNLRADARADDADP